MADAVATHTMYESATDLVVKFTNVSDGTGEAAVTKVDVSALSPACAEVDIRKIVYATDGMAVRILWDATADVVAWCVPANQHGEYDFTKDFPGGIRNNAGAGKTGDVQFTTVGHTSGDTYSIILYCKKRLTAEV
jgi:hypothetical protein